MADRLWVQVQAREPRDKARLEAIALPAIAADIVASGIGNLIKAASDHLIATDTYVISALHPYDPAFRKASGGPVEFLPRRIVLNVGAAPVRLEQVAPGKVPDEASPVVIAIDIIESRDRTAVRGEVTFWRYARFIATGFTAFKKARRKISIELKMTGVDAQTLLTIAIHLTGTEADIQQTSWGPDDRLPWAKRPTMSGPDGFDEFGVVNIEAKITEVAEPSGFAKFLGTWLGGQKSTVETFVKNTVMQALDQSAGAEAQLRVLEAARTARQSYETAYTDAATARKAFDEASAATDKPKARTALALKLAILQQRQIFAREAFNKAGLAFEPLPEIKPE
jgi:hypothetical protein